jgi:hypothetical protein
MTPNSATGRPPRGARRRTRRSMTAWDLRP